MDCIRESTIADIDNIYELITMLEEKELNYKDFVNVYKYNLLNESVFYWIYESNHQVNGFISLYIQELLHHAGKIAEIQELIVNDSSRGRGIGKQLFQKAKEFCLQNDVVQLEVSCNQKRVISHAFYKKQGMINSHYKLCMELYDGKEKL